MKLFFAIGFVLTIGNFIVAQTFTDDYHYYSLEEVRYASPDSVLAIDLSKLKLTELPDELKNFKNLEALKLTKNRLTDFPEFVAEFKYLKILYINKNRFTEFPKTLFQLQELETLLVGKNLIQSIPKDIRNLKKLKYFDIWDNRIQHISPNFTELQQLQFIDFRGTTFTPEFVEKWTKAFPNAVVKFDPPCTCIR